MSTLALITPPDTQVRTPNRPLRVIGIDLGTTNSAIAEILWQLGDAAAPKVRRIAILFPTKRLVYGYARALREAGLEVEVPGHIGRRRTGRAEELPSLDFSTPLPKLMPYPSAKGLTFDTVLMPRLIPGLFAKLNRERLERWISRRLVNAVLKKYSKISIAYGLKCNVRLPARSRSQPARWSFLSNLSMRLRYLLTTYQLPFPPLAKGG